MTSSLAAPELTIAPQIPPSRPVSRWLVAAVLVAGATPDGPQRLRRGVPCGSGRLHAFFALIPLRRVRMGSNILVMRARSSLLSS